MFFYKGTFLFHSYKLRFTSMPTHLQASRTWRFFRRNGSWSPFWVVKLSTRTTRCTCSNIVRVLSLFHRLRQRKDVLWGHPSLFKGWSWGHCWFFFFFFSWNVWAYLCVCKETRLLPPNPSRLKKKINQFLYSGITLRAWQGPFLVSFLLKQKKEF